MKTIPKELSEAAVVDGAGVAPSVLQQVILPLTRAGAWRRWRRCEFTWLYNDFFWGANLLNQGAERPITSSIAVLNGQYATDYNLIAAASIMIALPTLAVYLDPAEAFHQRADTRRDQGLMPGDGGARRPGR